MAAPAASSQPTTLRIAGALVAVAAHTPVLQAKTDPETYAETWVPTGEHYFETFEPLPAEVAAVARHMHTWQREGLTGWFVSSNVVAAA